MLREADGILQHPIFACAAQVRKQCKTAGRPVQVYETARKGNIVAAYWAHRPKGYEGQGDWLDYLLRSRKGRCCRKRCPSLSVTFSASSSIITALPGPRQLRIIDLLGRLTPTGRLDDRPALPLGDVRRQMGDHRTDPAGENGAAIQEFQPPKHPCRLDAHPELPAARRIEAGTDEPQFDLRPQPVHQGQVRLLQKVHRRGHRVVCAALQHEVRLAFGQKQPGG